MIDRALVAPPSPIQRGHLRQTKIGIGIVVGIERRLDSRFSWIDLDVDLDLHKQETG